MGIFSNTQNKLLLKISYFLKDLLTMVEGNELSKQQNLLKKKETV